MKQDIQMTVMAFAVITGLFLFQHCTDTVFKKKQAEHRETTAQVALPADLPAEWTEDGQAVEPKAVQPEAPKPLLAESEEELKGSKKVNAEIRGAFQTMADQIGLQAQKIDQAAVVADMKMKAKRLDGRLNRLEAKMAKQLGKFEAEAEILPLRLMHSELLDQIAAAEQADARNWQDVRPDQRYSFKVMRDDLREEIALTEQLLKEQLPEELEPQLASTGK